MDTDKTSYKKKKKLKRNPDQILFTFKTQQSAKNTSFLQNESTNIKKQSTHAFFDQKVKAHTPTFILFVKLCKKPKKKKKGKTLAVLLQ